MTISKIKNTVVHSVKIFLFLIVILFSESSFCQTETVEYKSRFGLHYSPEIGYRFVIKKSGDDWIDRPSFLFSIGAIYEYKIGKRTYFQTGLDLTTRGKQTFNYGFGPDYDYTNNVNYIHYYTETNIYYEKYYYVDVPLHLLFDLIQRKKINYLVTTGIDLNYVLGAEEIQRFMPHGENETINVEKIGYYNHFSPSLFLSFGAEYNLGKRLICRIEPNFKISMFDTDKGSFDQLLYNAGINFSFLVKI